MLKHFCLLFSNNVHACTARPIVSEWGTEAGSLPLFRARQYPRVADDFITVRKKRSVKSERSLKMSLTVLYKVKSSST